jgi:GNAT superfamily N-acetyltransferase
MEFVYLADHRHLLPELAQLHFSEWSYLRPTESLDERTARLAKCCGRREIPTVVVALEEGALLGSAMLVAHDMDARPDLTPWLAGVYVVTSQRRRGVGSRLSERIASEARALGATDMYLYTPTMEAFYAKRGWRVIDRCEYLDVPVTVMRQPLFWPELGASR